MIAANPQLITLENESSALTVDLYGGAIIDFHLKSVDINPLNFSFSKDQMPENNRNGAAYQGHFVCLGRWGAASVGEKKNAVPNHGQFANIAWANVTEQPQNKVLQTCVNAPLEGMRLDRKIVLDERSPVFFVKETVQNTNPLGRLYNMVQHPTLAAPFLNEKTIVDCNASGGFDQALYKDIHGNTIRWPFAKDDKNNTMDLRNPSGNYNAVISFIVKQKDKNGWVTAYSPEHNLLIGYIWKRTDYPWINLWQHWNEGAIQYRGIEFGTAGLHQPFIEILTATGSILGEKTYAYIDAGELISRNYFSFMYNTAPGFNGVEDIVMREGEILVKGKGPGDMDFNLKSELIQLAC